MSHGHFGENFAIEGDILSLGESNELGIGHSVFAESVVQSDNPESTEGALLGPTITPSILASLNHGFFGLGEKLLTAPAVALGLFENILVALFGHYAALDSSHTFEKLLIEVTYA